MHTIRGITGLGCLAGFLPGDVVNSFRRSTFAALRVSTLGGAMTLRCAGMSGLANSPHDVALLEGQLVPAHDWVHEEDKQLQVIQLEAAFGLLLHHLVEKAINLHGHTNIHEVILRLMLGDTNFDTPCKHEEVLHKIHKFSW